MKKFLMFVSIAASVLFICSCSKSKSTPANPNPIVGLWVGTATYSVAPNEPNLYYSFDIKSDSTLLLQALGADGNTYYGDGTWSLTGTSFTGTFTGTNLSNTGVVVTVTATYNSTTGTLIGTQGVVGATGNFTLNRIK